MASFFGSGPLPDWNEIRKWLGKELPWKLVEQWEKTEDTDWMDRFVNRLANERSDTSKAEAKSLVQIDTVKNAKKLTVAVRLPKETNMHDLRLYATSERLKVEGLPDQRTHTVRFPCRVFPRTGRAEQRDGQILIHFRRRPIDGEEVELFIRS